MSRSVITCMLGALLLAAGGAAEEPVARPVLLLVGGGQTVPVTDRDPLQLEWRLDEVTYRSEARVRGRDLPVSVFVAAADSEYLRLRSPSWRTGAEFPPAYRAATGLAVVARGTAAPAVLVPRDAFTSVGVVERVRLRASERLRPVHFLVGAAAGAAAVAVGDLPWPDPWHDGLARTVEPGEWPGVLAGAGIGMAVYSSYRLLKPAYAPRLRTYGVGPGGDWRLTTPGD